MSHLDSGRRHWVVQIVYFFLMEMRHREFRITRQGELRSVLIQCIPTTLPNDIRTLFINHHAQDIRIMCRLNLPHLSLTSMHAIALPRTFLDRANSMPQTQSSISPLTTFLIVCTFVLALFPSVFVGVVWAPYNSLTRWAFPLRAAHSTNVYCSSPNICVAAPTMSW